jgi:hypothetical protein
MKDTLLTFVTGLVALPLVVALAPVAALVFCVWFLGIVIIRVGERTKE